jgi:hypothetical protein
MLGNGPHSKMDTDLMNCLAMKNNLLISKINSNNYHKNSTNEHIDVNRNSNKQSSEAKPIIVDFGSKRSDVVFETSNNN